MLEKTRGKRSIGKTRLPLDLLIEDHIPVDIISAKAAAAATTAAAVAATTATEAKAAAAAAAAAATTTTITKQLQQDYQQH